MTIQTLDKKEWENFSLESLFTVGAGKRLTNADKIEGKRPFIGATDNSNGVTGFVGNDNASKDSNVLGVNYNGAPCIAFYHPYECVFTDDVKRLHLRYRNDNEAELLFFKIVIMQQRSKYSYGYKFKEKRMLRQKLMVPVTDSGEPDYEYMADYVRECQDAMLAIYRVYMERRIAKLGDCTKVHALSEKKWTPFTVRDLFSTVVPTKGDTTGQLVLGNDVPYIAASKFNNGYAYMCDGKAYPEWVSDGNCILFVQLGDGAAGWSHYIPMRFIGMNGKTSCGYSPFLNEYVGVFIARCLSINKQKFSYGHSWTGKRLLNTRVMLPTNGSGEPDYEYMEQYIKNMMIRKYKQYTAFLDRG